MSAYVCQPEHIGLLAAYAATEGCAIYAWRDDDRVETAKRIAEGLAFENIRSVAARYPNDKDGERPGPTLKDAQIVEAAKLWAEHYVTTRRPGSATIAQIAKASDCLAYQSCETDDWEDTQAHQQLDWIDGHLLRQLPGYEAAAWEWTDSLPAIDNQFYGVTA